jgi:DMSO/TMAO reductase YedYZ molybdopterin-dependent catalytic subunit
MTVNRRNLLFAAAAGLAPRLIGADRADRSRMIVRSPNPEDLEMPLDGFKDAITPIDRFFVRCHVYIPTVNLSDWNLKVVGLVNQPLKLTLDDLKKLPRAEQVGVLECAGNGRSFYEPRMAGAPWAFGSVGNARWTGVRMRDVLNKAGLQGSGKQVLLDGADTPLGKMPDFQRTLTIEKAMDPDTLLAFEMNGQALPVEHGFPLRVIASGWAGDSWVKWLQRIEVLDHEFEGFWMKTAYRHPNHPVAPGAAVDPKDMIPVSDLNVKSIIASPENWTKPGLVTIAGVAYSNGAAIQRVDVSTDGGETWKAAKLGKDQGRYSWRLWQRDWKAVEGKYTLIARATDSAGRSQPLTEEWNPSGYSWNVAQKVEIQVGDNPPPGPTAPVASAEPPASYKAACLACHNESMMLQQHLTRAQWDREVNKMTGWGAEIKPEDRVAILDYLSGRFK